MSIVFLHELGVNPIAYIGAGEDAEVIIDDVIAKACGRYLHSKVENTQLSTLHEKSYLNTICY